MWKEKQIENRCDGNNNFSHSARRNAQQQQGEQFWEMHKSNMKYVLASELPLSFSISL